MFWFDLAAHLGMSVRRCMEETDAIDYAYWQAYSRIQPFGGNVEDYRAGTIASAIAATVGESIRPIDFFPWHDKRQSAEAKARKLVAQMKANGLDIERKEG